MSFLQNFLQKEKKTRLVPLLAVSLLTYSS